MKSSSSLLDSKMAASSKGEDAEPDTLEDISDLISETSGYLCLCPPFNDAFYLDEERYAIAGKLFDVVLRVKNPMVADFCHVHADISSEVAKEFSKAVSSSSNEDLWRTVVDVSQSECVYSDIDSLKGLHIAAGFEVASGESVVWTAEVASDMTFYRMVDYVRDIPDVVIQQLVGRDCEDIAGSSFEVCLDGVNDLIVAKEISIIKGETT